MECSVGRFVREKCHKLSFSTTSVIKSFDELDSDKKNLLKIRLELDDIKHICTYHEKKYLDNFSQVYGKECCDPFKVHSKTFRKNIRPVTLIMRSFHPSLIPGKGICVDCSKNLKYRHNDAPAGDFEFKSVSGEPGNAASTIVKKKQQKNDVKTRRTAFKIPVDPFSVDTSNVTVKQELMDDSGTENESGPSGKEWVDVGDAFKEEHYVHQPSQMSSGITITPINQNTVEIEVEPKDKTRETEFEIFGRSIGAHLSNMPVRDALELQLIIQQAITQYRLRKCGQSSIIP